MRRAIAFLLWQGALVTSSFLAAQTVVSGRDPLVDDGVADSWSGLFVMTPAIVGPGGGATQGTVTTFNYWAESGVADGSRHVTPILVARTGGVYRVHGVGTTRTPTSSGAKSEPFGLTLGSDQVDLDSGATYHIAILQQRDGVDDSSASVVPFGGSGGSGVFIQNTIGPNHVPNVDDVVSSDFASGPGGRNYSFNFEISFPETSSPPTDIGLAAGDLFPGMPIGTQVGILTTVDPNVTDIHSYTLVSNPGGIFAIDGDKLELAGAPGAVGTNYVVRIRSTDTDLLSFEKDFSLTVTAALPPTDLTLSNTLVNSGLPNRALVATMVTSDGNSGDSHVIALVAGAGDSDNGLFTIANGNELRLASAIPGGRTSLALRLRTTDLSGGFFEKAFVLTVTNPSLRINEFVASNPNGLQDEDLDYSDWIEIFNEQGSIANVQGWYLTDDPDNLTKWQFPSVGIPANGFLMVFASGKDRVDPASELHTNFQLASEGEFLALVKPDGVTIADQFSVGQQYPDVSYGYDSGGAELGFLVPTPNLPNGSAFEFGLNEVIFSQGRGFYSSSVTLALSATVPGSIIRYTTDGSQPTATHGTVYPGSPFTVSPSTTGNRRGSRIVRAVAIHSSAAVQPVNTHTYLFVNGVSSPSSDGIVGQTNLQASITGHPTYGPLMDDALLAQPAISIVGGVPGSGEGERSVEFFTPDGSETGFQITCGMKVVGGHSVSSPKNNFRLYFRGEYGISKLRYDLFEGHPYSGGAVEVFDRLNLRSGSHDSFFWLASPGNPPASGGPQKGDAQYLRNRWIGDMQFLMGQEGLHGRWVHVYIDGAYHGQYHLHEWPNDDFLGSYLPGGAEDYEYTNGADAAKSGSDGWQAAWSTMKSAAGTSYADAEEWIDLENLADYQILNFYAGNPWDWNPNQNWMAGGPNVANSPSGGWKFFGWDSDICLQDPGANVLSKNVPDGLFQIMMGHEEFRVLFRDRVYKHCFHDGVLTPTRVAQVHSHRADEIRTSIIAETARWQGAAANAPWDRDDEWQAELDRMAGYFRIRTGILMSQLRAQSNWYPLEAPEFDIRGGFVASGHKPVLSAPSGTIYFTTDGSDPRLPGGAVNPAASVFSANSIVIDTATVVRARVWNGATWSALNEAGFVIIGTQLASTGNATISEVHYNPQGADDYEFIEFKNTSAATVDFSGVTISEAVSFVFPLGSVVPPGGHLLVVEDLVEFSSRYMDPASPWFFPGVVVAGQWSGMLVNSGEEIVVTDANGGALLAVDYSDGGSWPGRADGNGSAAELRDPALVPLILPDKTLYLGSGENWRSTSEFHGSPGRDGAGPDNRVVFNEIRSNPGPSQDDAFELLNTQAGTLDIGGWFVSNDADDFQKYRIADATSIPAGSLLVFDETAFNNAGDPGSLVQFDLNGSEGDDLYLLEADVAGNLLRFVDRAEFGAAAEGESFGRWPDGAAGELYPMVMQTFGELNSFAGNEVRAGPLVIAEIHYNPDGADAGREFISICNAGSVVESLDNWLLRGEVDFDFPSAMTLAPGAFLVVVGFDPSDGNSLGAFRSEYGVDPAIPILGPWNDGGVVPTKLNDGGGTVRLLRPDAPIGSPAYYPMLQEDLVKYDDESGWPQSPDGQGDSLLRIDGAFYGDTPLNWTGSSSPLGGVSYALWASMVFPANTPPADLLADADPDGDGIPNFGEYGFVLDPMSSGGPAPMAVEPSPGGDFIEIRYRARPGAHSLDYAVGVSADLEVWDYSEAALTFVSSIIQPDGSAEVTMRYPLSGSSHPRLFFNARVTDP